jgi:hypothetical protein
MEPGNVLIRVKATDNLPLLRDGNTISFLIEWKDILLWRQEPMPVILVVHDAVQEVAYWLYVQELLENMSESEELITDVTHGFFPGLKSGSSITQLSTCVDIRNASEAYLLSAKAEA